MSDQHIDETAPVPVQPGVPGSTQIEPGIKQVKRKHPHRRWILFGILSIVILVLAGSAVGYGLAIEKRISAEKDQLLVAATTQYELALTDERNGRLASALNRLEYVKVIYPQFPGIEQKLAEVMTAIASSTTPVAATPPVALTPQPTRVTYTVSDLYQNAQAQYTNQEWQNLIETVLAIRDADPTYEVIKVDDLYYAGLRNEGILLIQQGSLETGLYDFALAERIGPIDTDAEAYRNWARMYLTGASWWGINWEKVTIYFSQLFAMVPELSDSSGMSVRRRYSDALTYWGDQLAATGDYCGAVQKYEASNQISNSQTIVDKLNQARTDCENNPTVPTPSETATQEPTPTP